MNRQITNDTISQTVQRIALSEQTDQKMEWFNRLAQMDPHALRQTKSLLPLLYEENAAIRKQSAFLIEALGVPLKGNDRLQYHFALQDFDWLLAEAAEHPAARALLFNGFLDRNLRLRARLLKYIHERDCQNEREKILYYYGRTDYEVLADLYINGTPATQSFIRQILVKGSNPKNNTPYHCRQCAILLEKLLGTEALDEQIQELLKPVLKQHSQNTLRLNPELPEPVSDLDLFIDRLQKKGIHVNNSLTFPKIRIGSATGRITYSEPGLQTWPKEKRLSEISPPPGYEMSRFDYRSMEPMIVLNILLQKQLLNARDIPENDIYTALFPQDRPKAKRYLNRLINGGARLPDFNPGPFLWKLLPALDELRSELWESFNATGWITTIAQRQLSPEKSAANLFGKLMNRLIQGSAADFFNHAVLEIDQWFTENHLDARVYFLIFDEVWIIYKPHAKNFINERVRNILNTQHTRYGFSLPVTVSTQ